MADTRLSVRSASAKDLAYRLAQRENRSLADIDLETTIRAVREPHEGPEL